MSNRPPKPERGSAIPGTSAHQYRGPQTPQAYFDLIEKILTEDDRTSAVLAMSLLDLRLMEAIRSRMFNRDEEIDKLLGFGDNLPKIDFLAKCKLAYCMGIIDKAILYDLKQMAHARNLFAHTFLGYTFTSPEVTKYSSKLKYYKERIKDINGIYLTKAQWIAGRREESEKKFAALDTDHRERFIQTFFHIAFVIWHHTKKDPTNADHNPYLPPSPPELQPADEIL